MNKFAMFAMLMALSFTVAGCTPAEKKAADVKKADKMENEAVDAIDKGEMEKEKIDEKTGKKVGKDLDKADEAMEDAAEQDTK
jgi:hypothetical protein